MPACLRPKKGKSTGLVELAWERELEGRCAIEGYKVRTLRSRLPPQGAAILTAQEPREL